MTSSVRPGPLRQAYPKSEWGIPEPFGPDGWAVARLDLSGSVIVSVAFDDKQVEWVHASIAWSDHMPTYDDLVRLHRAVWGDRGWAFQVFAPPSDHVNIHQYALHLWGRLDGARIHPDFGSAGTI